MACVLLVLQIILVLMLLVFDMLIQFLTNNYDAHCISYQMWYPVGYNVSILSVGFLIIVSLKVIVRIFCT